MDSFMDSFIEEVLLTGEEISKICADLGAKITKDYDGKRLEAVNKIEDLFQTYLDTAVLQMHRNSTLCNLEMMFPVDMISSICGMILLKL